MSNTIDYVTSGTSAVASTNAAVTLITYAAPNATGTMQIEITCQVNDGTLYDRFVVSALVKIVTGTPTAVGQDTLANKKTAIQANAPVVFVSGTNILIQSAQAQAANLSWWCQARVIFAG